MLIFFNAMAYAYTFTPSVIALSSSGNESSRLFAIGNPEDIIIPIDITIYEFSKDIDGNPVRGKEVVDNFIIYPAQFLLKPKSRQSVQVRWVGDPSPPHELSFSIICRQIPLPEKKKKKKQSGSFAMINVLMSYECRVYVAPKEAESHIVIDSAKPRRNDDGSRELIITCRNDGNLHGKLIGKKLIVTPAGEKFDWDKSVTLTSRDIPNLTSSILFNSLRRFIIPWPKELPFGPVRVILETHDF